MSNLQQLLNERYPDSEISHIERKAFEEGWNAALNPETHRQMRNIDLLEAQYNPLQDHSDFHTIK